MRLRVIAREPRCSGYPGREMRREAGAVGASGGPDSPHRKARRQRPEGEVVPSSLRRSPSGRAQHRQAYRLSSR